MSSLATQLQGIASLDAGRLTSRTGAPSSKSYLFTAKTAAAQDLDAVYILGLSGFEELLAQDSSFEEFEDDLFSDHAKRTDRMTLNEEENKSLDLVLNRCLRKLGRFIGVMAGGRCIEWLVRRFRVHEMNSDTLIQVFLPYHSSPNFARMLAILTIPSDSPYYAPFSPLVKQAQAIPRSYISKAISPEKDRSLRLLNDVVGMVKVAQSEGAVHRALLSFWSGTIVDLLEKYRDGSSAPEGLVKTLVEAFVDLLTTRKGGADLNAAVYPPLMLLAKSTRLNEEVFLVVLSAVLTMKTGADPSQRMLTLLVLVQDRRDWDQGLGELAALKLSKVPQLGDILLAAFTKYGFENASKTVLRVMAEQPHNFEKSLALVVDRCALPIGAVEALVQGLGKAEPSDSSRDLLVSKLRERYPSIVDRLALQLPGITLGSTSQQAILGVHDADVSSRVQAISELLSPESTENLETRKELVLQRLQDDSVEVIQAIYSDTDRLISVLGGDLAYVDAVSSVFTSTKRDPRILRLHLDFSCNYFATSPQFQSAVFHKLVFPCLLPVAASKYNVGADGWKIVSNSPMGKWDILANLDASEMMGKPDHSKLRGLVDRLSASILSSPSKVAIEDFLLAHLSSSFTPSRLLSLLILAKLVRVEAGMPLADKALTHLHPMLLQERLQDIGPVGEPLSTATLEATCDRPDDIVTTTRATLELVLAISLARRPSDAVIGINETTNSEGNGYSSVARSLYILANNGILPGAFARTILQNLLTQLKDDALVFFASTWTSTASRHLRIAALKHALAFVQAYVKTSQAGIDLQLVVPALLVALQDDVKEARSTSVGILTAIGRLVDRSPSETYALDTIYGPQSASVQLLRNSDLRSYLQTLLHASDELIIDASRLRRLHGETLGAQSGNQKKNTNHRRAVIRALSSHVKSWQAFGPRVKLLSSLADVVDSTSFRGVLPLFKEDEEIHWLDSLSAERRIEFLQLCASTLNVRETMRLEEDDEAWTFLKDVLSPSNNVQKALRPLILGVMRQKAFNGLQSELKVSYILALLHSIQAGGDDDEVDLLDALKAFHLDSDCIQSVIADLVQPLEHANQRKKQKQAGSASATKADDTIHKLTFLVDARDWRHVEGDRAQLVATFMNVLSTLLAKRQAIKQGIDYLEQEIVAAILALLESITDAEEINKAHIGTEVIIKVIRASNNPRTSQRALLVVSELARFIPESILHNVMPIFTFMGASDFQRDDAYSFSVVERTISRIVPVLTESLKAKELDRSELYKEALPFMSIFTDMAGRLPRHRTLPFFVHLVKSLDPGYFLAPICMLLVDRTTTKAGRGGMSAVQALDLPIKLVATFAVDDQLFVVKEVLAEVARLVGSGSAKDEGFLSSKTSETTPEQEDKQAQALLSFIQATLERLVGQPCDQSTAQDIVDTLVKLGGTKVSDSALGAAMQLLSADGFFNVVLSSLRSDNGHEAEVGLQIFIQRLPLVRVEVRAKQSKTLGQIVTAIGQQLEKSSDPGNALEAIRAIVTTKNSSEDSALAQVISPVLTLVKTTKSQSVVASALSLVNTMVSQLGSRIIPSIQGIVDVGLSSLRGKSSTVAREALWLCTCLLDTVPTFISSKQLQSIIDTALEVHARDPEGIKKLMSAMAKKIQSKTLFGIVMDTWKAIPEKTIVPFFELLRLTLRHADRQSLAGSTKRIFAFFLEIFDLPWKLESKGFDQDVIADIETSAVGSFLELVTKLNEVTFRPLFGRLSDWAVIDLEGGDESQLLCRKIMLFKVMMGILNKFRNLLSSYIGTILPHVKDILAAHQQSVSQKTPNANEDRLWRLVIDTLARSFEVDEQTYWSDSNLLEMIPVLVPQLALPTSTSASLPATTSEVQVSEEGHVALSSVTRCLASLAGSTTSENVLKSLNGAICLQTRDDSAYVRIAALHALEEVWTKQGEEMTGFVPETVAEFVSELLEDESSDVEAGARKVLGVIEKVAGNVEEHLH